MLLVVSNVLDLSTPEKSGRCGTQVYLSTVVREYEVSTLTANILGTIFAVRKVGEESLIVLGLHYITLQFPNSPSGCPFVGKIQDLLRILTAVRRRTILGPFLNYWGCA